MFWSSKGIYLFIYLVSITVSKTNSYYSFWFSFSRLRDKRHVIFEYRSKVTVWSLQNFETLFPLYTYKQKAIHNHCKIQKFMHVSKIGNSDIVGGYWFEQLTINFEDVIENIIPNTYRKLASSFLKPSDLRKWEVLLVLF